MNIRITTISFKFMLLCLLIEGCVRFTPSRSSIVESYGGLDPAAERVGLEAFQADESREFLRLQQLVEERKKFGLDAANQNYRIGPGDMLQVKVEKFDEISGAVEVQPSGQMTLPQIGSLNVWGQTREEVVQSIAEQIADYLVDPQVDVTVTRPRGKRVWLMGSVSKPGSYPLERPNYSLIDFLADTGNVKSLTADRIYLFPAPAVRVRPRSTSHPARSCNYGTLRAMDELVLLSLTALRRQLPFVRELRQIDSGCQDLPDSGSASDQYAEQDTMPPRIEIDVERLYGGKDNSPLFVPLISGDKIFIPSAVSVLVHGEVSRRGQISLSGSPGLLAAIVGAGGLTYSADIENIEIIREAGTGRKLVLSVNLEETALWRAQDVRLHNGDIVWVPSSEGRFNRNYIITWFNALIGTGSRLQNGLGTGNGTGGVDN